MRMNHADRRSERTRQALTSALIQLMLEEGYQAVTVRQVATRARVGRSTFYLHFSDKRELLRQSLAAPSTQLLRLVCEEIAPRDLVPQLKHFHDQRVRNRVFLLEPIRSLWVSFLADMIEAKLRRKPGPRVAPAAALPRRLLALHLADSQLALIARWLVEAPEVGELSVAAALIASTRAQIAALAPLARVELVGTSDRNRHPIAGYPFVRSRAN
jgi:AcrR family transcriptional regulator